MVIHWELLIATTAEKTSETQLSVPQDITSSGAQDTSTSGTEVHQDSGPTGGDVVDTRADDIEFP